MFKLIDFVKILGISLIVTLIISGFDLSVLTDPMLFTITFLIAFLVVIPHELFHKYIAEKFGRKNVELHANIPSLIFGAIISFLSGGSVILFSPAYVSYEKTKKEDVYIMLRKEIGIGLAGPFANLLIGTVSFLFLYIFYYFVFLPLELSVNIFLIYYLLIKLTIVNFTVGFYNLIPREGYDGEVLLLIKLLDKFPEKERNELDDKLVKKYSVWALLTDIRNVLWIPLFTIGAFVLMAYYLPIEIVKDLIILDPIAHFRLIMRLLSLLE